MKTIQYSISLLLFLMTSCTPFVGVYTFKKYNIGHDENYTEDILINLQYSNPEIRVLEAEQSIFNTFDQPYQRTQKNIDSAYISKKIKDYYRHWNGQKIFIYTADNGNIFYELRVLDVDNIRQKCNIGITSISIKKENSRQWFNYKDKHNPQVINALKIFNDSLLPKLKNKLGEIE
jgi:hypothetical protein